MYKYLLGKHPKKSPGLPFFKVKLNNNKKSNISKKMNKSLLDLSKETELLVIGNDYLTKRQKNKNDKKSVAYSQPNYQEGKIDNVLNSKKGDNIKGELQHKNIKKTKSKLGKKFWAMPIKQLLALKLNKITSREKNKKRNLKSSTTFNINSTRTNHTIIHTHKRNDNKTERTYLKNLLTKKPQGEKHLFERILSSKKIKNSTYRNITKISSILNDTSKKYILIDMNLKNYSQNDSFKNMKKLILDKSLKMSKSQDDISNHTPINIKKIFDKKDNVLDKPLKQIKVKENKKNKMIWIKKSTANLISFGQVSQCMNDEEFYRERKRIIRNYLAFEKDADLYVKKPENEKNCYRSEVGYKNMRKIDELFEKNYNLIKNIMSREIKK